MHSCPSCKKPTSNLLVLDDGAIGNDVCDECALIAITLAYPTDLSLEDALFLLEVTELANEAMLERD